MKWHKQITNLYTSFVAKKLNKQSSSRVARLSLFFFEHIKLSVMLWTSLFLFGLFSYTVFMQRQGFPQVDVPVSLVQGVYFVNDKNVVDSELAQPVLRVINDIDEVKSTTANSGDNQVAIVVEYKDDITANQGSKLVEKRIAAVKQQLPAEAELISQPLDATRYNNKYDILLSVSGDGKSLSELVGRAETATHKLTESLPDAKTIEVISPFEEAINPLTQQKQVQQTTFDRFGKRLDSNLQINNSVAIGIVIDENEDIIAFDDQLTMVMKDINSDPEFTDIKLNTAASFAPSVRQQISSLQGNLFAGLAIVVLICLIFIGLRAGILAAIGLMVTMTTAVGILYLLGISLNTISLFGLVLCLGLIVDDTIIVVESLDAQYKKTKQLKGAVSSSISKVALASAAGTFTTILGFAPLLFISGILGEFIRILPVTIIIVLAVSLMVALLFVPFLARFFITKNKKTNSNTPFGVIRKLEAWLGDSLAGIITGANTRKKKIVRGVSAILVSLVFIGAAVPLFSQLKFDIFPSAKDSNAISVELKFTPGTTINQAEQITDNVDQQIIKTLGINLEQITYLGNANARQANASITLLPYQSRDITSNQLVDYLQTDLQDIQGASAVVSQVGVGPPKEQFPFKVQIESDDPAQADQVAKNLVNFLSDKEVTRQNGTTASINKVQYNGEQVSITRIDGQRIVEVAASFDASDTSALVQATQQEVEDDFLSDSNNLAGLNKDSVTFDFGFESENQESFKSVLLVLPFLILAMYILLAVQFKSLLQPLLILVAVPFSFFGVALALLLTNNPLSFFVMIAFFALIGISVNNSILLTDYANQERLAGLSPRYAIASAIKQRTRPLITTSVTSILALVPLALTDPFWESLAVTLIGGLTASAVLVLISFPYYYLALEALRSRVKQRVKNKK